MPSGPTRLRVSAAILIAAAACSRDEPAVVVPPATSAEHVLLITIDTLRADRVGAYGYAPAATPALDSIANNGARFDRAFSCAPITQTSHATILTGRYPQGHGARHNGMRIDESVPTLAERFRGAGFATGAFVAAFPLDRRFGLSRGFDTYSDVMPTGPDGRQANERSGRVVVDEAIAWLGNQWNPGNPRNRVFLWVHLFEPHAPYVSGYDNEVAEADRQVARLLGALGERRAKTLIVATSDHGEAFGEHGEIGHSLFVYDTTLRVPLLVEGPGIPRGTRVAETVGLVDVAKTVAARMAAGTFDSDGIDLSTYLKPGHAAPAHPEMEQSYYAESFAPLLDFGWSPLRVIRGNTLKYIEAPRPEMYDTARDPGETQNLVTPDRARLVDDFKRSLDRTGGAVSGSFSGGLDPDGRLAALGYVSRSSASPAAKRADPKDKVHVAAAIARITSGEAQGAALERELRAVLAEDPANPQMNLRLGHVLAASNRCPEARRRFDTAIRAKMPTADAHLGLASCQAASRELDAAIRTLREGARVEPGNPVVRANLGLMLSQAGRPADAIAPLGEALSASPDLHQARFGLALALADLGRRAEALAEARELLRRLPPSASQRAEVQRLVKTLSSQ